MHLPVSIRAMLGNQSYTLDRTGKSGAQILLFPHCVLKIEPAGEESNNEHTMLQWLQGRLPVPEVLASEAADGVNYLLMTRLPGQMACAQPYLDDPALLMHCLAGALQMLWSVEVSQCPCGLTTERKLALAEYRVAHGLCNMDDSEPGTYGPGGFRDPAALLDWLIRNRPQEDPVFSHGDLCLPNVFLSDTGISGFLDWGRSGTADRYQDIALCYRSLLHNFSGKYSGKQRAADPSMLFQELHLTPDWEKIRYYILLDELF